MPREFKELSGWQFDADEVSAGVYHAVGQDGAGRTVEATGIDPNELIEQCRLAAVEMMSQYRVCQ